MRIAIMKKVFLFLLITLPLFAQTKLSETDSLATLRGPVVFAVQDDSTGYNVWRHIHWRTLSKGIKDSADVWNNAQTSALLDSINTLEAQTQDSIDALQMWDQNFSNIITGTRWIMGDNISAGQISLIHLSSSLMGMLLSGDSTLFSNNNTWTGANTWDNVSWFDSMLIVNGDAVLLKKVNASGSNGLILPYSIPDPDLGAIWFDQNDKNGTIKFLNKDSLTRTIPSLETLTAFSSGVYAAQDSLAAADTTIDCSTGNNFIKVLTGNTTLSLTNTVDGQNVIIAVSNPSTYTLSWDADETILWSGGITPTQTTGNKTDIYSFIRLGDKIYANVKQNF